MLCLFGAPAWWMVEVFRIVDNALVCRIVVEEPDWGKVDALLAQMFPDPSPYRISAHHGRGQYEGILNRTGQAYTGICC